MTRYLVLVGLLCAAMVAGCETKDTKAPGGPTAPEVKQEQGAKPPAATPTADMPPDPFARQPAPQPALEIPKIEPPKIEKKPVP